MFISSPASYHRVQMMWWGCSKVGRMISNAVAVQDFAPRQGSIKNEAQICRGHIDEAKRVSSLR